jgi:hypothetical protein
MSSSGKWLWRALVTGAVWALAGGVIAFLLFPIYLFGVRPWEYDSTWRILSAWRILFGPGPPGAPSREQVLQAAAGFALVGVALGFIGGFTSVLQAHATYARK